MQDNDSKHVSREAKKIFWTKSSKLVAYSPEFPDLNPLENLWQDLKEYLRAQIKPRNLDELIAGIKAFCSTVDAQKCKKYIQHFQKVIPRVIEVQGDATG